MDKYYIPKYINKPMRIIFFTVDELMIMGLATTVVLLIGLDFMIGMLVSAFSYLIYKSFKSKGGSGYLQRKLYWKFNISSGKGVPAANVRKYKG